MIAQRRQAVWKYQTSFRAGTIVERIAANAFQMFGKLNFTQGAAARKGVVADSGQALRKFH